MCECGHESCSGDGAARRQRTAWSPACTSPAARVMPSCARARRGARRRPRHLARPGVSSPPRRRDDTVTHISSGPPRRSVEREEPDEPAAVRRPLVTGPTMKRITDVARNASQSTSTTSRLGSRSGAQDRHHNPTLPVTDAMSFADRTDAALETSRPWMSAMVATDRLR